MTDQVFQSAFINFQPELTTFLYRLVANKQDAEDQDELLDIRMRLVRDTDPLNGSSNLHLFFLENVPSWVEKATISK